MPWRRPGPRRGHPARHADSRRVETPSSRDKASSSSLRRIRRTTSVLRRELHRPRSARPPASPLGLRPRSAAGGACFRDCFCAMGPIVVEPPSGCPMEPGTYPPVSSTAYPCVAPNTHVLRKRPACELRRRQSEPRWAPTSAATGLRLGGNRFCRHLASIRLRVGPSTFRSSAPPSRVVTSVLLGFAAVHGESRPGPRPPVSNRVESPRRGGHRWVSSGRGSHAVPDLQITCAGPQSNLTSRSSRRAARRATGSISRTYNVCVVGPSSPARS